jgi:molecular chaperone DnaK (HSP70)
VLRPLLAAASSALGETVVRAVVTVPAYFDQAQRCVRPRGCCARALSVR